MKRQLLFATWLLMFLLALGSAAFVAQGLIRDVYTGDPVARVDLREATDWQTVPFRLWGHGVHRLYISSVNHDPSRVGHRFDGAISVRIRDPGGTTVFERTYIPSSLDHSVPLNYGNTELATIELDDWPLRRWSLLVRVDQGDPQFQSSITQVMLRKQRDDPGMGGLMNYAMILPSGVFQLLALGFSIPFARGSSRKSKIPLVLSAMLGLGSLLLLSGI